MRRSFIDRYSCHACADDLSQAKKRWQRAYKTTMTARLQEKSLLHCDYLCKLHTPLRCQILQSITASFDLPNCSEYHACWPKWAEEAWQIVQSTCITDTPCKSFQPQATFIPFLPLLILYTFDGLHESFHRHTLLQTQVKCIRRSLSQGFPQAPYCRHEKCI